MVLGEVEQTAVVLESPLNYSLTLRSDNGSEVEAMECGRDWTGINKSQKSDEAKENN